MLISILFCCVALVNGRREYLGMNGGTIVHLFEYSFPEIQEACASGELDFYSYIQITPIHEAVDNLDPQQYNKWWTRFQPLSYSIYDRFKNGERQFYEMVQECLDHGVEILVEVVFNHVSPLYPESEGEKRNNTKQCTSDWQFPIPGDSENTHLDQAECYRVEDDDFNYKNCHSLAPDHSIVDWTDPDEIRLCNLGELKDLATTDYVLSQQLKLLNRLLAFGVGGFYWDAARHMIVDHIKQLQDGMGLTQSGHEPVMVQKVVDKFADNAVYEWEYYETGHVTEFTYPTYMKQAWANASGMAEIESWPYMMPGEKATVMISAHDLQFDSEAWASRDGDIYLLANVLMLALPYGTPKVFSGFKLNLDAKGKVIRDVSRPAGKPSEDKNWERQHTWIPIRNAVGFRNEVHGSEIVQWEIIGEDDNSCFFFVRWNEETQKGGLVIMNTNTTDPCDPKITMKEVSRLPDGLYTNLWGTEDPTYLHEKFETKMKAHFRVKVKNGEVTLIHPVPASSAVFIHTGAKWPEENKTGYFVMGIILSVGAVLLLCAYLYAKMKRRAKENRAASKEEEGDYASLF